MTSDGVGFEALAQPGIRGLRAYDPGHDLVAWRRRVGPGLIELGSNENPWGPSAAARDAVLDCLHSLHRYPDPLGGDLKRALAAKLGVEVPQLLLGNGSHELLMQVGQVFAGAGDEIVASEFGFAVYALAAQAAGATLVRAPALPRSHAMPRGHDLDALADAITPRTRVVYLANPNNPTGTWFAIDALAAFLARVPDTVIVVVDEAYAEFVDDGATALSLLPSHPNLVVTRTFSKAHALAGLRVGYAVAHPGWVAVMERVRESFNVNLVGLAAAEAALADDAHMRWALARNAEERAKLSEALSSRGWFVHPSMTNFLLVEFGADTPMFEAGLLERGLVLRPMGGYGLPQCLRITVGDRDENRRLLAALDEMR
ncbi:histidinol-phosphate aminotransferase 2 [Lysobacter helvus]|uniref:Histidinol-phosphate aminotransferase n=2 Tax=Lysobacteraceae TaxID=32033 RepID=A0ABM7Q8J1_9GAMM|nr:MULTISPECIES: histidinol-phosphate transaminase [Lysobacter]BCT93722.1 histidinol-phosphate aminotransferase 2 [Lysobacter caseinilyticus]BCT96878.1 histidinol-phosphate aminotransferase 2 [Lysobacter helvus]